MLSNKVSYHYISLSILSATAIFLLSFLFFSSHRGLDITDEGTYLCDMAHPLDSISSISLYHVVLSNIYQMVDSSVVILRYFNVLIIFFSGLFLGLILTKILSRIIQTKVSRTHVMSIATFIGIGSLMFFYRGGLLTPSYNTFVAVGINFIAGLWLLYINGPRFNQWVTARDKIISIIVGVILSLIFISKISTAVLLTIFWIIQCCFKESSVSRVLKLLCYLIGGVFLGVFILLPQPHLLINTVLNGVTSTPFSNHNIIFLISFYALDIARQGSLFLSQHAYLAILFLLFCIYISKCSVNWVILFATCSVVVLLVLHFIYYGLHISGGNFIFNTIQFYLFWLFVTLCLLVCFRKKWKVSGRFILTILGLLILPILGACGSANPLSINTIMYMAPWFALIILVFYTLNCGASVVRLFTMVVFIIVFFVAVQVTTAFIYYPYRINQGILKQQAKIVIDGNGNTLFVDKLTADFINNFKSDSSRCGIQRDSYMLAFVDMPGLVYLSGARPLGVAWYLGNRNTGVSIYNAQQYNNFIINKIDAHLLANAYVLEKVNDMEYAPRDFFNRVNFPGEYQVCSDLTWPLDQTKIRLWKPRHEANTDKN